MTLDEVVAISKEKLVEYEPRLNVSGQKPYSKSANGPIQQKYEASLSSVNNEVIERMVSSVLEELVNLKDGFVMSEPPDGLLSSSSAGVSLLLITF